MSVTRWHRYFGRLFGFLHMYDTQFCDLLVKAIVTLCLCMPKIPVNSVQMCLCQQANGPHSFRKTFSECDNLESVNGHGTVF